ncbi:hypothetical protein AKJ43_00285 [candidate division MSBL1 archaeon SCGC-AAA261D19]|uniref:Cyclin-like domain-containing protein n=1 Tax=candidate division MSBL1 archaeon SCGC-AAA261D19 TaxID=1698273 RepID=A0A133V8T9_9EURY|nr:hypothetical protein AKJ43_00285 [candidate division MSBL1 archaeon SCGC-AAA261D19]
MICPSCESSAVVNDEFRREKICTRCGLVLMERREDLRPEWRTEPGEDSGRADVTSGLVITQHDMGLGSRIGRIRDLSPSWRAKLRRLRKWHRRSRAPTYQEKSLRRALIDIDKLCEGLDLPKSVQAEASFLYRKARENDLTSGRNTWSFLATLVFVVSRIRGIPRTEKEVVHALMARSGLDEREAFRALRRIRKVISAELDLKVSRARPEEYLDRFVSKLDLPRETAAMARQICFSLPNDFKKKKAASLLAASSIYVASKRAGFDLKIRELASTLGVGVSSTSRTGKRIRELLEAHGE